MGNYRNFKLVTYFVAHAAARIKKEELENQIAFLEKYMRLDKVYLEPWRGELASHEQIEMIRDVFHAHGVEVAGGLTTVIPTPEGEDPKPRLFDTFCYNHPGMRKTLREVSSFIGEHFDEFIIDDFFFTDCTCPACVRERDLYNQKHHTTGWEAYRLDLMKKVSTEDVIGPAKAANPRCRITIKYPNWAESYQETGYNPAAQRQLFDRIYTGTETRDPVTTDQHLPRYLSFSLMTYFESMWPGHNGGGWFDTFDTHVTDHYLEHVHADPRFPAGQAGCRPGSRRYTGRHLLLSSRQLSGRGQHPGFSRHEWLPHSLHALLPAGSPPDSPNAFLRL